MAQRLDASGAVKSSDLYNAYGKRLSGGGTGDDPYGFAGMSAAYTDSETGLSLLGQRFYDPSVSRFLNRDPIGYAGGMNLYRYAGNNPVMNMDPSGLEYEDIHDDGDSVVSNRETSTAGMYSERDPVTQRAALNTSATLVRAVPVVGGLYAGYVAATGCDPLTLHREDAAARGLDGVQAALEILPIIGSVTGGAGGLLKGLRRNPCNRCLTGDTPVQMADGTTKLIRDIQVGDQVLSRNPATGKDEAKTVTSTIERHAPSVVEIALHDAKTGRAETLTCTPEHSLYVQGQGWVESKIQQDSTENDKVEPK